MHLSTFLFLPALALIVGSASAEELVLPAPDQPEPRTIFERGESPEYYRLPDNEASFLLRVGVGGHARLPVNREESGVRFSFDALTGFEVGPRDDIPSLVTELGYSYVYETEHWFLLGLGPGLRRMGAAMDAPDSGFAVTLIPHGILGTLDDAFAAGVRTTLLLRYWMLGVEVAHQYARVVELDRDVHSIHFVFSPTMAYAGL